MQHPLRDPENIHDPRSRLEDQVALAEGKAGGRLNPVWIEWLMGFPTNWTECEVSETPSSPKSQSGSGGA
jgi:hypothetical protein